MAHLHPFPFAGLVTRMFAELEQCDAIFDLPKRRFFTGSSPHDLGVSFHGHPASSPLGPAAGPQSQMAQNLVLSWLGGCRIFELKTVQVLDELEIPRPCIDMQTIGFNVEWSQELKLEQSLEEYVKGAMLIEMLRASGRLPLESGFESVIYDMSVGYDLKGIQSPTVMRFIQRMQDATEIIDRLRGEIPAAYAHFRDLDYPTALSRTLTLSTFHGCPPDEIERIIDFLLRETGLDCVVKLNPTLLGKEVARFLVNERLGYPELQLPDSAFDQDTTWEQAEEFVERLGSTAKGLGLGFGVKFSNTLIVENHRDFFPSSESQMYLSGQPLHVLAMHLVRRFRQRFGDRYPISFSAGIDRTNFPDAVSLGLVPITVCTDLLRPGGYGRAEGYFRDLMARMDRVGARSIDEFVIRSHGHALETLSQAITDPATRAACAAALDSGAELADAAGDHYAAWVTACRLANTESYVGNLADDPRYTKAKNSKPPKKIGSSLELFDCITCDKCIPVCPNDANFAFTIPPVEIPIVKLSKTDSGWTSTTEGRLVIEQKHQIGTFADFCNECGNCDVFCPEDGGPYVVKPRFFGTADQWREQASLDGFAIERRNGRETMLGRFQEREYRISQRGEEEVQYSGPEFSLVVNPESPEQVLEGWAIGQIDLTYFHILVLVRDALLRSERVHYLSPEVQDSPPLS